MSESKSVTTRQQVKLTPQLAEDWNSAPGGRFRRTLGGISEYFQRIGEKIGFAQDLGWKAGSGLASAPHAKAEADYAKAENDSIDAELKRRTLEARTRHECADADKAEAEAGIAKIREIQARFELLKTLRDNGLAASVSSALEIIVTPAQITTPLRAEDILDPIESIEAETRSIHIRCPTVDPGHSGLDDPIHVARVQWLVSIGSRVKEGEQIGILEMLSSPPSAHRVLSQGTGTITFLMAVDATSVLTMAHVIASVLPDV